MNRGSFKTVEVVHVLGLQQLKICGILAFFGGRMWDPSSLSRIEPMPPALEARRLNHWITREVPQRACL